MKYHFWQFLINQEGQPINSANIKIYLAGENIPAYVYTSENDDSETPTNTVPQTTTAANGFFQFWVGDKSETNGYNPTQKFKIKWERSGITSGEIDNVEIFPLFEAINPSDSTSTEKNKLVSNYLGYKWSNHTDHDVSTDGLPIHGLQAPNTLLNDTVYNKLVSNELVNRLLTSLNARFPLLRPNQMNLETSASSGASYDTLYNTKLKTIKFNATNDGVAWTNFLISDDIDDDTDIELDLYYSLDSNDNDKNIKFDVEYWSTSMGSMVSSAADATNSDIIATGTDQENLVLKTTLTAIDNSNITAGDMVTLKLKRNSEDGTDTYSGDFQLIYIKPYQNI